jgi:hypothetical protein
MPRPMCTDGSYAAIGVTTVHVSADCPCRTLVSGQPSGLDQEAVVRLAHLYVCEELSTYRIAGLTGVDRQRITRLLRKAGVPLRPRGAGGIRPERRRGDPPGLPGLLAELYVQRNLTITEIAAVLGIPERTIWDRLRRYKIQTRTRGRWNREDRRTISPQVLAELYTTLGFTAREIGDKLGASVPVVLRNAHDQGVAVRAGGAVSQPGRDEIELVNALYADRLIAAALARHRIEPVPAGSPIWVRFPEPVPLTRRLVEDLYWRCGTGVFHIELLTGQPAETIRGFMRRSGIGTRHAGGRSPFLRRWRTGSEAGG